MKKVKSPIQFYFIMLKDDFFNQSEIKMLKKQKDGYKMIVFLQQLYLLSIENEGVLSLKNNKAHTKDTLSIVFDYDVDFVENSLNIFEEFGLIETKYGKICIDVSEMTGRRTKAAEDKERQRNKEDIKSVNKNEDLTDDEKYNIEQFVKLLSEKTGVVLNKKFMDIQIDEIKKIKSEKGEIYKYFEICLKKGWKMLKYDYIKTI